MIRNYIKTAFRSLLKNKGFTVLNVLGLSLGLASCLLIIFYVVDELSYDRYNTKADRIYRLNNAIKFGGMEDLYAVTPAPTAAARPACVRWASDALVARRPRPHCRLTPLATARAWVAAVLAAPIGADP